MSLENNLDDILHELGIRYSTHKEIKGYLKIKENIDLLEEKAGTSTKEHSIRDGLSAVDAAKAMGLCKDEQRALLYGGLLHDMGKVSIGKKILEKNDFNQEDMETMRMHPLFGYIILKDDFFYSAIISLTHHSFKADGYPTISQISSIVSPETLDKNKKHSRIIALVDFYDSIVNRVNNKYPESLSKKEIKTEMYKNFRNKEMKAMIDIFYSAKVFR